jgi:hypothetical protein
MLAAFRERASKISAARAIAKRLSKSFFEMCAPQFEIEDRLRKSAGRSDNRRRCFFARRRGDFWAIIATRP